MSLVGWIILGVVVVVLLYVMGVYNRLVRLRALVKEGFSGITVQLRRRADLIPNLIETVKGYAAHEKTTLQEVIELRNKAQAIPAGDVATRGMAENLLGQALGRVMAIAEAYPDLKANTNFLEMQRALDGIEGEIQMARRYYNGSARELNIKVESFPSNLIANPFGFAKKDYFEITNEADRALPQVKF
jgi:LemA protein